MTFVYNNNIMEEVPPDLILNCDQTGIHVSAWTMDVAGS